MKCNVKNVDRLNVVVFIEVHSEKKLGLYSYQIDLENYSRMQTLTQT